MSIVRSLAAVVLALAVQPVSAHDILVLHHDGVLEVKYGHPGDWQYLSSPGCLSTRLTNNSGFSLRHFCSA